MKFDEAQQMASRLRDEMARAIIGQDAVVQEILIAFFAGGHVLLRGVPGPGQDAPDQDAGPGDSPEVQPHPVHART